MRVFVWKSHGDVDVYSMDTQEKRDSLRKTLAELLIHEGAEVTEESSWSDITDAIYDAIESRSNIFENGTGITQVREV